MNTLKGEYKFEADGSVYRMVYTIDALIDLEERFGKTVIEIAAMLGGNLRIKDLRTLFRAGLAEHHADLDEKAVGRVMTSVGIAPAGAILSEAFLAAFGAGVSSDGEAGADAPADPPPAAGGTGQPASTTGSNSASEP